MESCLCFMQERPLTGLVKYQALVRGFLVRKRVVATLYSMQALLRARLDVRSQRAGRPFKDHRVQPKIRHRKSTSYVDVVEDTYETKASEEMDSKLNITNKKQQILAKRKRILDVENLPGLSRSYSFDYCLSGTRVVDAQDEKFLPPYDTIENYISPRLMYLRFNRDSHNKIKSVPYDCGVSFLEEIYCSVEEMEDLVKESLVSTHDENEGEKEEFDEVKDGSGRKEAKLRPNTAIFCRRRNEEMEAHYSPQLEETTTQRIYLQSTPKGLLLYET
ncbi:IQ-DOMAIN 14-like protein [Tanacetum coccineum]